MLARWARHRMTDRKRLANAITPATRPCEAFAVRRDGTGLTRESGYERENLMSVDAHARKPIRSLAHSVNCRYCESPIYVAICFDGKWRSFDPQDMPAAPAGVWAWRRRQGMQEQDLVPGKRLHYCAEYSHFLATNGALP